MAKYGRFNSEEEVYAAVFGWSHNGNKVTRSAINRILKRHGFKELDEETVLAIGDRIRNNIDLGEIYADAAMGITREDELQGVERKVTLNMDSVGDDLDLKGEQGIAEVRRSASGDYTSARTLILSDAELQDEDALLKYHKYDPKDWQIKTSSNVRSTRDTNQGEKHTYTSRITVQPRVKPDVAITDILEAFNQEIKPVTIHTTKHGTDTLVIPLFDLHFGINRLEFMEPHLEQIAAVLAKGYKRVEILIGGDTLHSDYLTKSMTGSGTQLDHVETLTALNEAESFFSSLIALSLENAPEVSVKAISGNHDVDSQYMFVWGMERKFPQVTFDNHLNSDRVVFQFGTVGIMMAHGNLAAKKLPMLFATEYPEIWSTSTYRMVATGHYHTLKVQDVDGVVMHQFGTNKPTDNYEYANGYSSARKHLQLMAFSDSQLLATYEVE